MRAAVVLPRRPWMRRLAIGVLLSIAAVVGVVIYRQCSERLDCESAVRRAEPYGVVTTVCREEYQRTRRPATGARLAEALRRSGETAAAAGLANELLATEARPDAFYTLGEIAVEEGRLDAAAGMLQEARKLHRAEGRRAEVGRDMLILGKIHVQRHEYAEALDFFDQCITEAQAGRDGAVEGLCHLGGAHALIRVGIFKGARQQIDLAEPLLSTDRDLAKLWFERANVEQEASRGKDHATSEEQAVAAFEKALSLATRARLTSLIIPIELNLTFSLAELRRLDEAEHHHEIATSLDRNRDYTSELAQLAARIAYRRKNLPLASAQNERLYADMPPGDDRFEVCVMQARIALAMNDLAAAETWARRGIQEVEKIRAAQTSVELRPWVLASRRAPYELMFATLARSKDRFQDAVEALDHWQGRTLLDAMSQPRLTPTSGLADAASMIRSLGRWLPAASTAPLMSAESRGAAEVLRSIDLLALAVIEGDVWRVVARRGQVQIKPVGALTALADRLDRFQGAPTDRAIAGELGELLLPSELYRDSSTLHVVLDPELAGLPVVALRRDGQALIAARPVLRMPRLPAKASPTCAAPDAAGGATVLADAKDDLPAARRESQAIARLLGTTARVGADATSAALFAAKPDRVLHAAVHADFDAGGGILGLHDRSVSALEILVSKLGPPLVVLSACSTARSDDPELAGSLSTAFLANGSSHVVATLRPVSDSGALALTGRFYREGGATDPVRTLAAIQADLADSDNKDWPNFAVFGTEACVAPAR